MKRLLFATMAVCSFNIEAQLTSLSPIKERGIELKDWWFNNGRRKYLEAKIKGKQADYNKQKQDRTVYEQNNYKVFDKDFLKHAEERLETKMPLAGFETKEKIHNVRLYNLGIRKYEGGPIALTITTARQIGFAVKSKFNKFCGILKAKLNFKSKH